MKLNAGLYVKLDNSSKKRDGSLRKLQNMAVKAVNNLAKVAEIVLNKERTPGQKTLSEEELCSLHTNVMDSLGITCQVSYQLNLKRVRSFLQVLLWCSIFVSR